MSYTPFVNDFDYTKKWTNADDFPTFEAEESQVRADMQVLYDEIAAGLNTLTTALKAVTAAGYLGVDGSDNFSSATNAQDALQALSDAIDALVVQTVPANSIETAMIKDSQITEDKLADGSVTTPKLADDAVTAAKIDDGAVGTAALASGAVTPAKVDFTGANMTIGADGVVLTLGGQIIGSSGINYGDSLPVSAEGTGQLFFLKA